MRSAGLAILYEAGDGRPLTVARVGDRRLLVAAAEAAILEAETQASALTDADEVLGAVQHEEAERLRRVLRILVPEVIDSRPTLEIVSSRGTRAPV